MNIEDYMDYAKERARWHISKHPSLRGDIMSVSMLALVQAAKMQPLHPKGCISRLIDNAVAELVSDNDIIRVPRSTKNRMLKDKREWPKALLVEQGELWDLKRAYAHPTWVVMHLEDVKKLLNLTEYEETIIEMRMQDYTLDEIGQAVGRTKQTIHHALDKIAERYRKLIKRHPEILRPDDQA